MNKFFNKSFLSGFVLLFFALVFYSFFWNKIFAPNVEGWFEYYAVQINNGLLPYKDFYLFTTPLFPYVLSLLFKFFGNYFYISHLMGVAVNIFCMLYMYRISQYLKLDSILSATICAVAVVIFSIDTGEPTNYYNHLAVLFLIISCYYFIKVINNDNEKSALFLIGLFAILSFMTKQTIGAIWIISIVLVLLVKYTYLYKKYENLSFDRSWISKVAIIFVGFALPLLIAVIIMHSKGMLSDFIDQVLIKGPSSKGNLKEVILRPILNAFVGDRSITFSFYTALIFSATIFINYFSNNRVIAKAVLIPGVIITSIFFIVAAFHFFSVSDRFLFRFLIYVGVLHSFFILLFSTYKLVSNDVGCDNKKFEISLVISLISLVVWFSLGMSYPVYEPMAMTTICAPVFNTLLLRNKKSIDIVSDKNDDVKSYETLFILIAAIIIYNASVFKYLNPWSWSGWAEPSIGLSVKKSTLPELKGLKLPESTVDVMESITSAVKKYSKTDNDVYMYPFFPSLYMTSHKNAYVFAYSAFIDVAPDFAIEKDMKTLINKPPRVLVKLDYPRSWIENLEGGFRQGNHHSAQSELYDYLAKLSTSYKVVEERRIMGDVMLRVYVNTED